MKLPAGRASERNFAYRRCSRNHARYREPGVGRPIRGRDAVFDKNPFEDVSGHLVRMVDARRRQHGLEGLPELRQRVQPGLAIRFDDLPAVALTLHIDSDRPEIGSHPRDGAIRFEQRPRPDQPLGPICRLHRQQPAEIEGVRIAHLTLRQPGICSDLPPPETHHRFRQIGKTGRKQPLEDMDLLMDEDSADRADAPFPETPVAPQRSWTETVRW